MEVIVEFNDFRVEVEGGISLEIKDVSSDLSGTDATACIGNGFWYGESVGVVVNV